MYYVLKVYTIEWSQVFHSLLKAHAVEARAVVRQALEILTPAMPGRMEDGNVSRNVKLHILYISFPSVEYMSRTWTYQKLAWE